MWAPAHARAKSAGNRTPTHTLSAMLSSGDKAILDFERFSWTEPGGKDQAIEWKLGLTAATYYERLRELLVDPAALAYDPLTVKRVSLLIDLSHETELAG